MDRIIIYDINTVDYLRRLNTSLNTALSNEIFSDYNNIYLKGGAARLALQLLIYPDRFRSDTIRDIDLALISPNRGDRGEFLDTPNRYDVDIPCYEGKSISNYMKSRDVTLNEVLIRPNMIAFTKRAHRDISRNVLNLSYSKYIDPDDNNLNSRGLSRLILFSARYGYEIKFGLFQYNWDSSENFNALLCLFKAFESNVEEMYFNISRNFKFGNAENSIDYVEWFIYLLMNVGILDQDIEDKILNSIKYYTGNVNLDKLYDFFPNIKSYVESINYNDEDKELLKKYLKKNNRHKMIEK